MIHMLLIPLVSVSVTSLALEMFFKLIFYLFSLL
jgi:hypothetical protein